MADHMAAICQPEVTGCFPSHRVISDRQSRIISANRG
jgi:hypothetical protein